jgi:hypothetical protein
MRAVFVLSAAACGGRLTLTILMNYTLRDNLLKPYSEAAEFGGVRYFRGLPVNVAQKLIDGGFVEMGPWNDCPGVADAIFPFLRRNSEFTAHGYAVSPERQDARITIEGVERSAALTKAEIIDFATSFNGADEIQLTPDYARCWYD